jgi:hypothetical protein
MAFKKPKKEKKSRLKDIEDLLKKLRPDQGKRFDPKDIDIEDILKKLKPFKPLPFDPRDPRGPYKPLPFNPREPREPYKPLPFNPRDPREPYKPLPFNPRDPREPYKPLPFPESFDPRDFLEMIEAFDNELGRNVFIPKIKVLEDEGRYSPTKRAGGGVMNINTMTEPLGYDDGGDVGFLEGIRQSLNNFIKYQRKDPERFFGGRDGMEFHLDDPSLIQFIKKRAETDDEDSPEYRDELMKFMEEVSPKKNQGGIISLAGGGLLSSVGDLDTKIKKLELMDLTGPKGLSLAEIDELDNMSASQIDELYKQKFGK